MWPTMAHSAAVAARFCAVCRPVCKWLRDHVRGDDSNKAFCRIEQEGCRAQTFAAGTDHIGGANIAAALLADVLLAEDAHQDEAEGNGAQQICENADDEVEQHGRLRV